MKRGLAGILGALALAAAASWWTARPVELPGGVRAGIFDVDLPVPPGASVHWSSPGGGEASGPTLPARLQHPGDTWRADIVLPDGGRAVAHHTVPEPPGGNVLVLLFDDAGIEKIGAYGHEHAARTPRLDALAGEGVRFTRAYAAPVCSPTRGILLTGRHARRTGLGWLVDAGNDTAQLPVAALTIPEVLRQAPRPWSNSAVGKWHLSGPRNRDAATHPNRSGFDWFAGTLKNPEYGEGRGYFAWSRIENGEVGEASGYLTSATVDDALARIHAMPEPWFLYVAFHAPHTPVHVPPAHLITTTITDASPPHEKFDAMLEALDTEIGRLLDGIPPETRARTTVFALGDNGSSKSAFDAKRKDVKASLYEGGIRIPLLVTGPHVRDPGRTSDALVHVADLFPTVAHIAGVPLEGPDGTRAIDGDRDVELDGRSLLPLLAADDVPWRDTLYAESFRKPASPSDVRAVLSATHKLVRSERGERLVHLEGPFAWDSDDLLSAGPLSPHDEAAYEALKAELARQEERLVYEGR